MLGILAGLISLDGFRRKDYFTGRISEGTAYGGLRQQRLMASSRTSGAPIKRAAVPASDSTPQHFNYRSHPQSRLTQAEKAAESRRRVLDAALSCLIDRGYSNTTTMEIADRAGLSRGSQLYHFPNKDALLTSAVEYLTELRIAEFRTAMTQVPRNADLWQDTLKAFWVLWDQPLYFAWLELIVAARTDERLRKSVAEINQRTNDYLHQALEEIFRPSPEIAERFRLLSWLTFFALGSMVIERSVGDFNRVGEILDLIASLGRSLDKPRATGGRTRRASGRSGRED